MPNSIRVKAGSLQGSTFTEYWRTLRSDGVNVLLPTASNCCQRSVERRYVGSRIGSANLIDRRRRDSRFDQISFRLEPQFSCWKNLRITFFDFTSNSLKVITRLSFQLRQLGTVIPWNIKPKFFCDKRTQIEITGNRDERFVPDFDDVDIPQTFAAGR